jgi:hypothetical protein
MGYNNVSYREAKQMIYGKNSQNEYDRFKNPTAWPSIVENRDIDSEPDNIRITKDSYSDKAKKQVDNLDRNRRINRPVLVNRPNLAELRERSEIRKRKTPYQNFYKNFNNREMEITKEKRGIALRQNNNFGSTTSIVSQEFEPREEENNLVENFRTTFCSSESFRNNILEWIFQYTREVNMQEQQEMRDRLVNLGKKHSAVGRQMEETRMNREYLENNKRSFWLDRDRE